MAEDRRPLRVRVIRPGERERNTDLRDLTPAERIAMMWQLTVDAWAFQGESLAESRLPRHVVRVVRGKS